MVAVGPYSLGPRALAISLYQPAKHYWEVKAMCISATTALILGAASIGTAAISASMAPKPPKPPDNSAFLNQQTVQAKKAADTSSTAAIKAAKKASGPATPNTLLSGGVGDDELNQGSNLLS